MADVKRWTLTRMARWTLACLTVTVVLWSFIDVTLRSIKSRREAASRAITLTIMHWGSPEEDQINEKLAKAFEAQHPDVRIERINAGNNFRPKLKTMMAAGTPPDLFYLTTDLLPDFATMGLVSPVDNQVAEDRAKPGNEAYYADIYPILLKYFSYDVKKQEAGEGKLFGLPKDSTTILMYINKDLFQKAGVPIPYDGWTWTEFESACKKITALTGTAGFEGRKIFGANLDTGDGALRMMMWRFGGDYFNGTNYRDVLLDEPGAQETLKYIRRLRLDEQTVYNATGIDKDGGQEFFNGNIGMYGPVGRWLVPRYKAIKPFDPASPKPTDFTWDVVPLPHNPGIRPRSLLYTTAWGISPKTKHPKEAFELMKFLCGPDGAKMQSELGLAIPPTRTMANSPTFLSPPGLPAHHAKVFLDEMDRVEVAQTPKEAEWSRILGDQIKASIQLGDVSTEQNAKEIEAAWLAELASPLRQKEWGKFPWRPVVMVTAAALVTLATALFVKARREKLGAIDRRNERAGFLFIAPWLIGFFCFALGPMILSLLLSMSQWSAMTPVGEARWVGIANFKQIVETDPAFVKSIQVTLYFVILSVPVTQIAALAVALLMNQGVRGIGIFRTIYFVPTVVSGVALSVLWLQIFNNDYGLLNTALRPIAAWLGTTPPDWFGRDAARWAIPAFVIMGLWGVGGGMIIYLAGLKGIPTSLYEAATIDGAGPGRRFWNVTLPMLSPLLFYNLVMGIIGSFQVFTQAYVMTGAGPNNATLFYVLQLFRQAFEFHNMGYASALAWILFVICLGLTLVVFAGGKKLVYYEGLK